MIVGPLDSETRFDLELKAIWARADAGDETAWVGFCGCASTFSEKGKNKPQDGRRPGDITSWPLWHQLSEGRRSQLRNCAHQFLLNRSDGRSSDHTWSNFAEAAYHGLYLLRHDLATDEVLRQCLVDRWSRIAFDFRYDGPERQELVALVHRIVPDISTARLAAYLRSSNRGQGYLLELERFSRCWDDRLKSVLHSFVLDRKTKPCSLRSAFRFLARHDSAEGLILLRELLAQRPRCFKPLDERGRSLLAVALFAFPESCWGDAWPVFAQCRPQLAEAVLLESKVYELIGRNKAGFQAFTDAQLLQLYARLRFLFPPERYNAYHGAGGLVSPEHQVTELRDALLNVLVSRGSPEVCAGLRRLALQQPEPERVWLLWRYHDALNNLRRSAWSAMRPSSAQLLRMASHLHATTVHSHDDLFEAVLDSLGRLQERLHLAESTETLALWNEPMSDRETHPSPKTEEALSNTVVNWLGRDLGAESGVILNREVQATRYGRLDIKVQAASHGPPSSVLTLVIEVKGHWNRQVTTSLKAQLVEIYLVPNGWTHGIYLVGWFPDAGKLKGASWNPVSAEAAQAEAECWAKEAPLACRVQAFVLECVAPRWKPRKRRTGGKRTR